MRLMSFQLTTDQILNQTKCVTRRAGWTRAVPGQIVQPVRKGMGLKRGETVERLGPPIRFTDVRRERLADGLTWTECQLEGFPEMAPEAFVEFYVRHNGGAPDQWVTRIAFEYLAPRVVLEDLDPGIRDTVALLQRHGFVTTDSGDGVSKADALADGDALPYPHVFAVTAPDQMIAESHRMANILGPPWVVEASYGTTDRKAILMAFNYGSDRP